VSARHQTAAIALVVLFFCCCVPATPPVRNGLDRLIETKFAEIRGLRVGLIVNHTSCAVDGRHAVDLFAEADSVDLQAIFCPEHGFRGEQEGGDAVSTASDPRTGLPVYSLYGEIRRPTAEMVQDLDAMVFDIQDVGTRFYTYISTLFLCMQTAAEHDLRFFVLDRPNPIGGTVVEGPVLSPEFSSFIGIAPIALRHGMSAGELALLFNQTGWLTAGPPIDLTVIPCSGWQRQRTFSATGLAWIPPSPNMISPQTALLYPGTGLLEGTNVSEGRGTDDPFRLIGAPWLDATELCRQLKINHPIGVEFDTMSFIPRSIPGKSLHPKYMDQLCQGLYFTVTDPDSFRAVELGVGLMTALHQLHPQEFSLREERLNKLLGTDLLVSALKNERNPDELISLWQSELHEFMQQRKKALIYP